MKKIELDPFIPFPLSPLALVGATVDGRANFSTAGALGAVNAVPPVVYVSLNHAHLTPKGIEQNGAFSLNFPSADLVEKVDFCGIASGAQTRKDKLFTISYGEHEGAPLIEECPLSCECVFSGQSVTFAMDTLYFAEVTRIYLDPSAAGERRTIDLHALDPLFFSGLTNEYYGLGGTAGLAGARTLGRCWSVGKKIQAPRVT